MAEKNVKISLSVISDGKNEVKKLKDDLANLNKEFKIQEHEMKNSASAAEKLEFKIQKLNAKVNAHKEILQKQNDVLEKSKKGYGENSKQVQQAGKEILKTRENIAFYNSELIKAQNELDKENQRIKENAQAYSEGKEQIKNAAKAIKFLKLDLEVLNQEFKTQKQEMKLTASSTEKYEANIIKLNQELKIQKSILKENEKVLELCKKEYGESSTEVREAKKEFEKTKETIAKLNNEVEENKTAIKEEARAFEDSKRKIQENSEALKRNSEFVEHQKNIQKQLADKVKATADKYKKLGDNLKKAGEGLQSAGRTLMTRVTLPIITAGGAATKFATDFEDAFTGVRKTVDATEEEYSKLRQGILNLSKAMPKSAVEIAKVEEAAGQLGIAKENIEEFSKTMIMLGDTTNLNADEAATALARFSNITQMNQRDFGKLGSVVVDLGNNFATTEAEIVALGSRLAGTGNQVGIAPQKIMGIAAALSSVGLEAEAGGTAFSKLLVYMQEAVSKGGKELEKFADVAGETSEQFSKGFKEDAAQAVGKFLKGLKNIKDSGGDVLGVLSDMDLTEVRLRDAILRGASASDIFTEALEKSNEAWYQNNALTNEAEKKYDNFKSKLIITKNKIQALGIKIGDLLIPKAKEFLEKLELWIEKLDKLNPEQLEFIIKIAGIVAAIGPAIFVIGKITSAFGVLSQGLSFITPVLSSLIPTFGGIALPVAGLVVLVGSLAAAFLYFYTTNENVRKSCEEVSKVLKEKLIDNFDELKTSCEKLCNQLGIMDDELNIMSATLSVNIKLFGIYLSTIISFITGVIVNLIDQVTAFLKIINGIKDVIKGIFTLNPDEILKGFEKIMRGGQEWVATFIENILFPIRAVFELFGIEFPKVIELWDEFQKKVLNILAKIKSYINLDFEEIKQKAIAKFEELKQSVIQKWEEIKCGVKNELINLKNDLINEFNTLPGIASTVWERVKQAITRPILNAVSIVQNGINKMRSFFNFSWSLPRLKMPHFSVSGKFSLNPPSIPRFNISWYKKGGFLPEGGIMTRPTIFGMNGSNLMAGGEAGAEAILPLSHLDKIIENNMRAINAENNGLIPVLIKKLDQLISKKTDIYLDSGELVGSTIEKIDYLLGQRANEELVYS